MRRSATVLFALMLTASPAALLVPTASATNFAVLLGPSLNQSINGAPAVALGPEGYGVAAWSVGTTQPWIIYASRLTPEGGWSRPIALSPNGSVFSNLPDAAASAGGYLAVAWDQGPPSLARAAIFSPAVGWLPAVSLLNGTGPASNPRVADAGGGSFAFVWVEFDTDWATFTRTWSPPNNWGPVTRLESGGAMSDAPDIAGDGSGALVAAWCRFPAGPTEIATRTFSPAGGWGALTTTPLTTSFGQNIRASLMGGRAAVSWLGTDSSAPFDVQVMTRAPGAAWSAPFLANTSAVTYPTSEVAVDGLGGTHLLFQQSTGGWDVPVARSMPAGATWGPAVALETNITANTPALVASNSGVVRAVWGSNTLGKLGPYSALLSPGGSWVGPTRISPETTAGSLVVGAGADAHGNTIVAWSESLTQMWGMYIAETQPPAVSIVSPQDRATIDGLNTIVEIDAEAGSVVFGNGISGRVPGSGHLTVAVTLRPGNNDLTFEAVDDAGNRATDTVTVFAIDPTQTLLDTINSTRDELAAAQAALNATQAQLAASQQAVAEGTAATAALSAQLNTTRDALNQSTVAMEQLFLNFEEMKLDYNGSQSDIAQLEVALQTETAAHNHTKQQQIEIQSWSFGLSDRLNLTSTELNETRGIVQHQQSDLDFLMSHPGGGSASSDSTALVLGVLGMSLGAAGLGASIMIARRGAGGASTSSRTGHEATHTVQQGEGKVEVRGWDPKMK